MLKIQQNVSLALHTSFKIGGPAKYFIKAQQPQDLTKAIDYAQSKSLPFFILGQGSNLLVNDAGFNGVIVKNQANNFKILKNKIITDSGTLLADLVSASIKAGLTGLEWAIGIPGTIGGAVKVNASAYDQEMSSIVEKIEQKNDLILKVCLKLEKGDSKKSHALTNQYLIQRKQSQPLEYASAGCIFKNPAGYHAGELIDKAGLKGERIKQAMVSEKHANFIINLGKAKAKQVKELIKIVKKEVFKKYQIKLKEEINYLGF